MQIIAFTTEETDWKSPRMGILLHDGERTADTVWIVSTCSQVGTAGESTGLVRYERTMVPKVTRDISNTRPRPARSRPG